DAAPSQIYTLSLHDALPISFAGQAAVAAVAAVSASVGSLVSSINSVNTTFLTQSTAFIGSPANPQPDQTGGGVWARGAGGHTPRSEEHTSELQSRGQLVCRL